MKLNFAMGLQKSWYKKPIQFYLWLFIPFSALYFIIIKCRRFFYKMGLFSHQNSTVPIIVVGNLTVGGSGKTPLVIHIATLLKQYGRRPGIVSRGYGRKRGGPDCIWVSPNSEARIVGDEPLLLAKRLLCPIVIAENRAKAVSLLCDSNQVDVIISDDGLQHYAMDRLLEITVVDGLRRYGNEFCLPAGPLREPLSRLKEVDLQVVNLNYTSATGNRESVIGNQEYEMELRPKMVYNGLNPSLQQPLSYFQGKPGHALAGIGNPESFFRLLKQEGLIVREHPFLDHRYFTKNEVEFEGEGPIFMTEKDAVKCSGLLSERHWVVTVDATVNPLFDARLLALLEEKCQEHCVRVGN